MATIQERAKNVMSDEFCSAMNMGRRDGYISGATDQRKIDIDKACEWIKNYAVFYVKDNNVFHFGECIADFRKAMEGKA